MALQYVFVEDGFPVGEGADMAKDLLQEFAGLPGVLANPVCPVGIGAYGDNFSAQLSEPHKIVGGGKVAPAAIHAAGVQL